MSLRAEISGAFELDETLERALVDPSEGWTPRENPRVAFSYSNPRLWLSANPQPVTYDEEDWYPGLPKPIIQQKNYVGFVVDKEDTQAALRLLVTCTVRVLKAVDSDLLMSFEEIPKLIRRAGELTLLRSFPENDFWDDPKRLGLVPEPYDWHRLPTPSWYEEMKARGEL